MGHSPHQRVSTSSGLPEAEGGRVRWQTVGPHIRAGFGDAHLGAQKSVDPHSNWILFSFDHNVGKTMP